MNQLVLDSQYDDELHLIWVVFNGPGYHSQLQDGTRVHDIRSSAEYVLECLGTGDPGRVGRATAILDRLCTLQDTNPVSPTYGIWSWTYEEPLAQMNPPDWNWADFIGARLAQALKLYADRLPCDTVTRVRGALTHAAWSIFRRNVDASYTNIAIMGAVVTAAAGEILNIPFLLDYACRRLESMCSALVTNGSFNEYNSPTYTAVAVEELDRLFLLVDNPECRALADRLWLHAWELIAEHFHPATRQWAGPHARAYSDYLSDSTVAWISAATGLDLMATSSVSTGEKPLPTVPPRRCPVGLAVRFEHLPHPEVTVVRQFIKRAVNSTTGTTWMNDSACLASANRESTWVQRRFLLAYWNTTAGVAMLKMSALMNGRAFPGFMVQQQQDRTRVLTALHPVFGTGEYHPLLNTVADGRFTVSDLRIRYELRATSARAERRADESFILSTDTLHSVIRPASCFFDGMPITWSTGQQDGAAFVDGVLYAGPPRIFDFTVVTLQAAIGLELLESPDRVSSNVVSTHLDAEGRLHAEWANLRVEVPVAPSRFEW